MPLGSSITSGHADKPPIIEMGKIINVDTANWLVDVSGDFSGRIYQDIQMVCPYVHYNNGEGVYVMPEVGAVCVVASLSDGNPPVVLGFAAALEEMFVDEESDLTTDEAESEGLTEAPPSPDEEDKPAFSYRNGRQLHRPGDVSLGTRDGNFVKLRRGGSVQIGSRHTAQTIFMPIKSLIRTFAQNYDLELTGGSSRWEVIQEEDGSSSCLHTAVFREYAEDAEASAIIEVGELDDNFVRFRMLMQGVNAKTGEMSESPVIELTFTKAGDIVLACQNYTKTVETDQTIEVKGTGTETYGSLDRDVKNTQTLKFKNETREGQTSKEKLASKTIEADSVILGGAGGAEPAMKGTTTMGIILGHTHDPTSGAIVLVDPTAILRALSKKVKLS
jgi:hypothetical protein